MRSAPMRYELAVASLLLFVGLSAWTMADDRPISCENEPGSYALYSWAASRQLRDKREVVAGLAAVAVGGYALKKWRDHKRKPYDWKPMRYRHYKRKDAPKPQTKNSRTKSKAPTGALHAAPGPRHANPYDYSQDGLASPGSHEYPHSDHSYLDESLQTPIDYHLDDDVPYTKKPENYGGYVPPPSHNYEPPSRSHHKKPHVEDAKDVDDVPTNAEAAGFEGTRNGAAGEPASPPAAPAGRTVVDRTLKAGQAGLTTAAKSLLSGKLPMVAAAEALFAVGQEALRNDPTPAV